MNWQPCLGIDLHVPPDFGHWFAGFTDGEGSFTITPDQNTAAIVCKLEIGLRDDDAAILHTIQQTLHVGHIYPRSQSHYTIWQVKKTASHKHVIIPLFEAYPLRAKKAHDFTLWAQAAHLIHAKAHHTEPGRQEILRLKTQMENGRQYNGHNPDTETVT